MVDSVELIRKRDFFEDLVYTGFEHQKRKSSIEPRIFQRYTQDSPVMPDVWIAYGIEPFKRHDLLLTPVLDRSPGRLASKLKGSIQQRSQEANRSQTQFENALRQGELESTSPQISYNQTTVVARLWFHELVQIVLPHTAWWWEKLARAENRNDHPAIILRDKTRAEQLRQDLRSALSGEVYDAQRGLASANLVWMTRVVGTIAYAIEGGPRENGSVESKHSVEELAERSADPEALCNSFFELLEFPVDEPDDSLDSYDLHSVNRNRPANTSMYRSVPTVKADAAQQLFDVHGRNITWAILDSGIDATHLAFRTRDREGKPKGPKHAPFTAEVSKRGTKRWENPTRIKKTYDFTRVRRLLSGDDVELVALLDEEQREQLKRSLAAGRFVDWEVLEPALEIKHDDTYYEKHIPTSHHGTHVAGILGADWRFDDDEDDALPLSNDRDERPNNRRGMCPEITLYDLRVTNQEGYGDEFSIMAALQFIRSLNARRDYVEIHGVNLSLSIQHEVSNYACGRTPICNECERLVGAGTVVVASAGNHGRARYLTNWGDEEAYASTSISDPGNAAAVITVGSTHRQDPHTYGVSYFSSRGPTGDGRMKPDLVAPGEKICSTIPGNREEYLDGTSMAAPHVSGAAALLMSRYSELIGNPQRIKQVLCETATDLGRERYFQGAGLLDILRALQSL